MYYSPVELLNVMCIVLKLLVEKTWNLQQLELCVDNAYIKAVEYHSPLAQILNRTCFTSSLLEYIFFLQLVFFEEIGVGIVWEWGIYLKSFYQSLIPNILLTCFNALVY